LNERFALVLRGSRRKRIPLEAIRLSFREAHPELHGNPESDRLLLEALRELADGGVVALPAERSWERFGNPAMPKWVSLVRSSMPPTLDWATVPWVPELGFWVDLQPRQLEAARAINEFLLRRRGALVPVPLNERSAEIFGDEKRLASLTSGESLFGGRLPLRIIGAFHVATPLPYRAASAPGRPVLIVENHHSYWSFGEWNSKEKRYAAIVYGSGHEFAKSGIAIDQVLTETGATGAEYFGDLDENGLAIPADFSARRAAADLSSIRPAEPLYAWLLAHGKRQSVAGFHKAPPERALHWLPIELRAEARMLLEAGSRIAQECLGYEVLLTEFR
jgi:Uncharacterized protein conserved in bacteria C-term(DUF2220)